MVLACGTCCERLMEFSYSALDDKVTTDSAVLESDIEISLLLLTWVEARKHRAFSGRLIYWTCAALSRMNRRAGPPVGASSLVKNLRTPRGVRSVTSSLTTIVGTPPGASSLLQGGR